MNSVFSNSQSALKSNNRIESFWHNLRSFIISTILPDTDDYKTLRNDLCMVLINWMVVVGYFIILFVCFSNALSIQDIWELRIIFYVFGIIECFLLMNTDIKCFWGKLIKSIWDWTKTRFITIIVAFVMLFVFLYYEDFLIKNSFSFIGKIKDSTLGISLLICLWGFVFIAVSYHTIQSQKQQTLYDGRSIFVSFVLTIIAFQCLRHLVGTNLPVYITIAIGLTTFLFNYSFLIYPVMVFNEIYWNSKSRIELVPSEWPNFYLNDDAIDNMEKDELHFEPHLHKLIEILNCIPEEGSHSIAITGGWGKGKTSFLNLLQIELKKSEKYEVIWFNPLKSANSENIQNDFFDEMETALIKYKQGFDRSIKNYKELIGAIDNKYVSFLLQLQNIQLEDEKKRIESTIEQIPKKIVIIIDDVDRLNEKEVSQIFRLVRFNAKFNKVVFLLALDKNNVIKTLGCDEKYPDKFFEMEFPLPDNGKNTITDFIKNNEHLKSLKLDFFDRSEIADYTNYCIDTLRDAKRFLNYFINRVGIINGVLDLRSYYILSLIQYKSPTLYEQIHNKEILLDKEQHLILKGADLLSTLIDPMYKEDTSQISKMLNTLFPNPESSLEIKKPINHKDYFEEYFTETSTKIVLTTQMVKLLLEQDECEFENKLKCYLSDEISKASMVRMWKAIMIGNLINSSSVRSLDPTMWTAMSLVNNNNPLINSLFDPRSLEIIAAKSDIYHFLYNNTEKHLQHKITNDNKTIGCILRNHFKILQALDLFDFMKCFESEEFAPFKYNNKWGYLDKDFNLKTPFVYEMASSFSKGFAYVRKYGKYRLIYANNKEIFESKEKFDEISLSSNDQPFVRKNRKQGIIDNNGIFRPSSSNI